MMTVKHIEPDGTEHVFQVESLSRLPDGELVFNTLKRISSGRIYVMDMGKTVATYDFTKNAHVNPKEQR
jgi:hypothetical protein